MIKRRILVTGIGGDIGQSIAKCLKDSGMGNNIAGCDIDPYAAGRILAEKFYKSPWAREKKSYSSFITNICKKERIQYIFPSSEPEIMFFDSERNFFSKKGITVFINDHFCIKTFFDKYATVTFLKNNGFLYPRTYRLDEFRNQLPYPVLLKQLRGWGGKGQHVIHDRSELSVYRKTCPGACIQEIIGSPQKEYTASVFSDGKTVQAICFERSLGYGSLTKVAKLINDRTVNDLAEKLAGAVNLKGSLNIQLRKTPQGYVPFEINPRFSSTVYIRHHFGFQDVRWWINMIENEKSIFKLKYRKGVAVRSLAETYFDLIK
jgi:carbamoyl-phosphate synthase large subunit